MIFLETKINMIEQYGRQNNIEITVIHNSVSENELEKMLQFFLQVILKFQVMTLRRALQ